MQNKKKPMDGKRRGDFRRNQKLEAVLEEINSRLTGVQHQVNAAHSTPNYPVVFVVGCPRAGTTLFMQWIAQTNQFAYPSNLISRFYAAPYIGALIQQMLFDPQYRFRDEFSDLDHQLSYRSTLGKTRGVLDPNEFWYFWRRYFPEKEVHHYTASELEDIDLTGFLAELASLEAALDKPWIMKGLYLNLNIPYLYEKIPKSFFINIRRDPIFTAQSLLESRSKFFGDVNTWYSFKPREYESLKELDPPSQVAGQVYYTNQAIDQGLANVPEGNQLLIDYEAFCDVPRDAYFQLRDRLNPLGCDISPVYPGLKSFEAANAVRLSEDLFHRIQTAYKTFSH